MDHDGQRDERRRKVAEGTERLKERMEAAGLGDRFKQGDRQSESEKEDGEKEEEEKEERRIEIKKDRSAKVLDVLWFSNIQHAKLFLDIDIHFDLRVQGKFASFLLFYLCKYV